MHRQTLPQCAVENGIAGGVGEVVFRQVLGRMSYFQPLAGDSYSYATAISDKGLVLGLSMNDANFNLRAALWENGKPTDRYTLVPNGIRL